MYYNDSTTAPGTLSEKLHNCIAAMLANAVELRQAIVARNVQAIWDTLAAKEEQAAQLEEYIQLWQQLYGDQPLGGNDADSGGALGEQRQQIHFSLQRLQATEQTNASLARTYLGAIRKAFDVATPAMAQKRNTYTRHGRVGTKNASLLVKRIG